MDQIRLLYIQPGCLGPGYKGKLLSLLPIPHELFLSLYPSERTGLLQLRSPGGQDRGDIPGAATGKERAFPIEVQKEAAGLERRRLR